MATRRMTKIFWHIAVHFVLQNRDNSEQPLSHQHCYHDSAIFYSKIHRHFADITKKNDSVKCKAMIICIKNLNDIEVKYFDLIRISLEENDKS